MIKTRVLKTNRQRLLREIEAAGGKARFARALGLHLTTLNSLLNDTWERVERDTIERLADHLNCDLNDLFSLQADRFWQPFIDASSYRIVRGVVRKNGVKIPLEEQAKTSVINFFQGHLSRLSGGFAEALENEDEIVEYAQNNNCVVIGTHHSNPACEILVSRHFQAKPFDSRPENRHKIPFRLIKLDYRRRSAFIESPQPSTSKSKSGLGVYSEALGRLIVEVDRLPEKDYLNAKIRKGHDAAIVLVINKPLSSPKNVKLIVLAGFSRIGTLAAAQALAQDYRDLEPIEPQTYSIGVIDATFDKSTEGDNRELVGYNWVFLEGGRRTISAR